MPKRHRHFSAVAFTAILAATVFAGAATVAVAMPDETSSSPVYTMSKRTYLWVLPKFWMGGDEAYGYFRIENTLDQTISVYMHCWTSNGTLPEMTGRFTLRPRQVTVVDSRKYRSGGRGQSDVLVRCSLKSNSLATVQYLIRDGRIRNFGDYFRIIRPEIS